MKEIIVLAEVLIAACISFNLSAQQVALMQRMSLLNQTELRTIENNLTVDIKREAATRTAGQFNVIILSGDNNINKQNTAKYLAQKTGSEIYRISLSQLVTKNLQQTKENFIVVFEAAKNKNRILFFDEAEALFGNRTTVNNAHDRFDDEETNYFLAQVEEYRCSIIISASNNINPLIFKKFIRFSIN